MYIYIHKALLLPTNIYIHKTLLLPTSIFKNYTRTLTFEQ